MKKAFIFILFISVIILVRIYLNNKNKFTPYGYGFKSEKALAGSGNISNFSLLDHNGDYHELYRYSDAKVIVLITHEIDCPILQKSILRLNELQKKYNREGIVFFMLNSNSSSDRKSIIENAKKHRIEIPILMDPAQVVAESLGLTRSAEALVILPGRWEIAYQGALKKGTGDSNDLLDDTLSLIIRNEKLPTPMSPSEGSLINFTKATNFSYSEKIAPLIQKKCLSCHTEAAGYLPYLDSYSKLNHWSEMIKETLMTERMPPFNADLHYGSYSNDNSLSPEEKKLLISWINAGLPNEDGKDDRLQAPNYGGLRKRLADTKKVYSISMQEEALIPPTGTTEYQYKQLGGPAPRDMYISAIDVKSTNPRQIHHASIMVVSKPLTFFEEEVNKSKIRETITKLESQIDGDIPVFLLGMIKNNEYGKNPNYIRFQVWAAGKPQPMIIDSRAHLFVPKGAYIILESHYMGTGKEETERTTLDFYEPRKIEKNAKKLKTLMLYNSNFSIPPNVKNFKVESEEAKLDEDINVLGYLGHLHMRGKAISVVETSEDDEILRKIMSIPNFYYGWHTGAGLVNQKPQLLKKGTRLRAICQYDNSVQNPNNPDPFKVVKFGQRVDRTEMCMINLGYYSND